MELECLDYVAAVARLPEFHFGIDFRPGDIQLLNNLTVLHWRTAYTDDPDRKRLLIRLWLNLHEGRPLAPEVRRRAAMGPRKQQAPESSAGLSVGA
jgi:alpha-ketoglutarate-dependent taurine dioxygenase